MVEGLNDTPQACFAIRSGARVGYISAAGDLTIPARLANGVYESSCGLVAVQTGDQWGFLRWDGREVVPPTLDHADYPYWFQQERAFVRRAGHWVLLDDSGRDVRRRGIDAPTDDYPYSFHEDMAAVLVEGRGRWMDRAGQIIGPAAYGQTRRFSQGRAACTTFEGRTWGYANDDGELVIAPRYTIAGLFREYRAPVALGPQWGYVDPHGREVVEPRYDLALPFSEGLAFVRKMHRWAIVDSEGQVRGKLRFEQPTGEHALLDHTLLVADCDAWHRLSVHPMHARAGPDPHRWRFRYRFSEGLAPVKYEGRWGYVGKDGEWAIEPRFAAAGGFTEGVALVADGEPGVVPSDWYFIDRAGEPAMEDDWAAARRFSSQAPLTMVSDDDGKQLYVDPDGEVVYPRSVGLLGRLKSLFSR